jgi:hypothetical protein
MISSAPCMILSISSSQVGMSWMSPAAMPQLHAAASISPSCSTRRFSDPATRGRISSILDSGALVALDGEDLLDRRIGQHALGIAQWSHDQARLQFTCRDQRLLHIVVRRRLLRRDKPRVHIDAVGAEGESGDQTARIGHAARSDKRGPELFGDARQQDHVWNVVLARMPAAFETVDADRIAADPLCSQRMANRGAFMDDFDAVNLQGRQILLGVATGSFDDADAAFDDRVYVFRIGRCGE